MNTNQLGYFKALYEKRNLAAAARSIPISHQGLSKALARIETELGATLFTRLEDGSMQPTAYAEVLLEHAAEIDRTFSHLHNEFRKLDDASHSEIRIATASGAMGTLGSDFLDAFSSRHPKIKLSWLDFPDLDVDDCLIQGIFNLGMTVGLYHESLRTVPLHSEQRCLWVRRDDPLATLECATVHDLEGYRVGIVSERYKNHQLFLDACQSSNTTPASIDVWTELFWLFCYAKKKGHVSFTVQSALGPVEDDGSLTGIPIEGFDWSFGLSYRPGAILRSEERAFIDFCIDYAEKHPPQKRLTS